MKPSQKKSRSKPSSPSKRKTKSTSKVGKKKKTGGARKPTASLKSKTQKKTKLKKTTRKTASKAALQPFSKKMHTSEDPQVLEFIHELQGFAATAEQTLNEIESALIEKRNLFRLFYEKMFAIRGTAQQLELPAIAQIAELGEEISLKATTTETRPQLRRCVSSLWDALTTTRYLLEHLNAKTDEEREILIHRLKETLRILGGAPLKLGQNEVELLLQGKRS